MKKILSLLLLATLLVACGDKNPPTDDPVVPKEDTVQKISLSMNTKIANQHETYTLTYTIEPASLQDKCTVIWASSDEAIASVSEGVVNILRPGECKISATVEGTSISDTCLFLINAYPPTITFSQLQCDGQDLVLDTVSDNAYNARGALAQKRISGRVKFESVSGTMNTVAITFSPSLVHSWGICILDYSYEWMTSRIEQPQNGVYSYSYRGGYNSTFSFSFIATGNDPVSVPIVFSATNAFGKRTSIELTFKD